MNQTSNDGEENQWYIESAVGNASTIDHVESLKPDELPNNRFRERERISDSSYLIQIEIK